MFGHESRMVIWKYRISGKCLCNLAMYPALAEVGYFSQDHFPKFSMDKPKTGFADFVLEWFDQ
jgi:hypothetical protein